MQTIDAVKTRILRLCDERNMSINKLAAAVEHQEYPLRQELQSEAFDDKNDLRRAGYNAGRVFLNSGVRQS